MKMMSVSEDAADIAKTIYIPPYLSNDGVRAGFRHYGTLLEDGRENCAAFRTKLTMPVLVLNGERGIPQAQTLGCVQQVAENFEAKIIPGSGHAFADDNPVWVADKLIRFF